MLTGVDAKDTGIICFTFQVLLFAFTCLLFTHFIILFAYIMNVYICMYDCVCEFRCIKSEAYLGYQSLLSASLETRSFC